MSKTVKQKNASYQYDESYCEDLKKIASEGGLVSAFCVSKGIGRSSFFDYLRKEEDFRKAYEVAVELKNEFWRNWGKKNVERYVSKEGYEDFDTNLWKILKNGVGEDGFVELRYDSVSKTADTLIEMMLIGQISIKKCGNMQNLLARHLDIKNSIQMQEEILERLNKLEGDRNEE